MKLAFIGGGNMARAILGGILAKGAPAGDAVVVEVDAVARLKLQGDYGVRAVEKPGAELADAEAVIFAVKPQQMRDAARAVAPHLGDPLALSIAAGIRIEDLSRWLGGCGRIVRAMPPTPAPVPAGITRPSPPPAADVAAA